MSSELEAQKNIKGLDVLLDDDRRRVMMAMQNGKIDAEEKYVTESDDDYEVGGEPDRRTTRGISRIVSWTVLSRCSLP